MTEGIKKEKNSTNVKAEIQKMQKNYDEKTFRFTLGIHNSNYTLTFIHSFTFTVILFLSKCHFFLQ